MTARDSTLLQALSFSVCTLALVGCGNGYVASMAPGPPPPDPPPVDAGRTDPPPTDSGPPEEEDAGPPPDNCTIETRPATPEESLAEFTAQGIPGEFGGTCVGCHSGRSPSGIGASWGATENTDQGWFDAVTTMLARPDHAGLSIEESRVYAAFAGTFATFTAQHPDDPTARAALVEWGALHIDGVSETVCTDAGPGPGPDPGECTPTIPSEQESLARFNDLGLGDAMVPHNCNLCHVGGAKSATASDQSWGATTDDASGWHTAFYGKAKQENAAADVTQSVLYTHLNGSDGTHSVKANERDLTGEWLEYVLNGDPCP